LEQFRPFKPDTRLDIATQIANHLKSMLQCPTHQNACLAQLPSVMELAGFYRCSPLDVLDGLYSLKNQRYEYVMNGLDSDVLLYGSILAYKPTKVLPAWLYPWEREHKLKETPLTTPFQHQP
jgi:hypothetical protein